MTGLVQYEEFCLRLSEELHLGIILTLEASKLER